MWCVADGIVGDIIPDALEGNSGSICSLDASEIRDAVADGGAVALSATNVRCMCGSRPLVHLENEECNNSDGR